MSVTQMPSDVQRLRGLLNVVAPELVQARSDLVAIGRVAELFYEPLCTRLMPLIEQTLVVELHKARLRGELRGADGHERFDFFARQLNTVGSQQEFRSQYPVLVRRIDQTIANTIAFAESVSVALHTDRSVLEELIHTDEPLGEVEGLSMTGDPHCDGRCVLIFRFSCGANIVYKPRSLAMEHGFQQVLSWLNGMDLDRKFLTVRVCDRGSYGWMQFAVAKPCTSLSEAKNYYWRLGAFVALAHVLGATDLHHENLIAVGEHPVFVDLETLLQPRSRLQSRDNPGEFACELLRRSVIETGLVPVWHRDGYDVAGPDVSGIGADLSAQTVPVWDRPGTDEMRIAMKSVHLAPGPGRPMLDGHTLNATEYIAEIDDGFTAMVELLLRQRTSLLDDDGPLEALFDAPSRVILRDTTKYVTLLRCSRHPKYLRDEVGTRSWLAKLELVSNEHPELAAAIPFEKRDLGRDDVPYFVCGPRTTDLRPFDGPVIENFFAESGRSVALERITNLGREYLQRQRWILTASITALGLTQGASIRPTRRTHHTEPYAQDRAEGRADALGVARAIGDRLEATAVRRSGRATWVGIEPAGQSHYAVQPLGLDLYDGLPGIVLFLAHLERATGDAATGQLARDAFATLEHQIEDEQEYYTNIGGFVGWAGLVYTYHQLGTLWAESALTGKAEVMTHHIRRQIDADDTYDILGGCAGAIAVLLATGGDLDVARQAGDRLIRTAKQMPTGVGWKQGGAWLAPLAGFAHGAAGIAWALMKLADATQDSRYLDTARAAFSYERDLFDVTTQNWPDLRSNHREHVALWCHGAPGIGLSRLDLLTHFADPQLSCEVRKAIETTLRDGFGHSHCLCHGDLGNLELIRRAQRVLPELKLQGAIAGLTARIVADVPEDPQCGLPANVETPGLMTGLAGIGYGLLRISERDDVPCVLLLESL